MGGVNITNMKCVAWAIEKETGDRLESSEVSIEMAINEGWYTKNGSKWKTMPEHMHRYRAAPFFARIYSPELTMGIQTVEEVKDVGMKDVTPEGSNAFDLNKEFLNMETGEVTETEVIPPKVPKTPKEEPEQTDLVDAVNEAENRITQIRIKQKENDKHEADWGLFMNEFVVELEKAPNAKWIADFKKMHESPLKNLEKADSKIHAYIMESITSKQKEFK
jgi:hypothetical protein